MENVEVLGSSMPAFRPLWFSGEEMFHNLVERPPIGCRRGEALAELENAQREPQIVELIVLSVDEREPGAGPGPHPAVVANDSRPGRAGDARRRPQRDHVAVRGPERATGAVIGTCSRRHRQQEFLKFLNEIDAQVERGPGVEIHIIRDNYGAHKTPAVKRWFERHPEYHLHFTPTSGS